MYYYKMHFSLLEKRYITTMKWEGQKKEAGDIVLELVVSVCTDRFIDRYRNRYRCVLFVYLYSLRCIFMRIFVGHDVCSTGMNMCTHMPNLCQRKGMGTMAPSSNEHTQCTDLSLQIIFCLKSGLLGVIEHSWVGIGEFQDESRIPCAREKRNSQLMMKHI